MLLISVATVLVLAIAFFQVVQGLFSSLIMTLLAILSAAAAFNYYEPLAASFLYARQPAYADSVSLVAIFFFLLLGLRLGLDYLISGNVVFGPWVDRIGGGVLGLITGVVITGVLMAAIQMLPFAGSVLGYIPFDNSMKRTQSLAPFKPDEAVLGMMKGLSNGSLSGDSRLDQWHSDMPLESFCMRNRAEKGGRIDALPEAVRLQGAYVYAIDPDSQKPSRPWSKDVHALLADEQDKIVIVRVSFDENVRDEDNWFRIVGTQLRLTSKSGRDYYPLGYLTFLSTDAEPWHVESDFENGALRVTKICAGRQNSAAKSVTMDWVYRMPKSEEPARLNFRRTNTLRIGEVTSGAPPAKDALGRFVEPKRT